MDYPMVVISKHNIILSLNEVFNKVGQISFNISGNHSPIVREGDRIQFIKDQIFKQNQVL